MFFRAKKSLPKPEPKPKSGETNRSANASHDTSEHHSEKRYSGCVSCGFSQRLVCNWCMRKAVRPGVWRCAACDHVETSRLGRPDPELSPAERKDLCLYLLGRDWSDFFVDRDFQAVPDLAGFSFFDDRVLDDLGVDFEAVLEHLPDYRLFDFGSCLLGKNPSRDVRMLGEKVRRALAARCEIVGASRSRP